jgi:lauroyl/myristoyl acyltransferase
LPVFVLRQGPRHFEVVIEPPLDVPDSRDYAALTQYAQLLEAYVKLAPTEYRTWQYAT